MLATRGKSFVNYDREAFEKSLSASINKAINITECAVKEKHARIVIIASHKERSGVSYWHIVRKLPLQDNPLIAWKFCHVTHKLLRDGHPDAIKDSLGSLGFIRDLGKLWGHLREGYGTLIAAYANLLYQKLIFHQKNPKICGNLIMDDERLDHLCNNDINSYFELSVDMLDYMDCILKLQNFVFNSMDMSRSNSMTSSGQCKLAPLIPSIQDSCQLYHFLVQILFKLHSSLPADTLCGHRDRFYKQFNVLKQFYTNAKSLQYFKNLIQIPDMPNSSPNFLRASELSSHVKPMALVSEQVDYGNEADNCDNVVSDLVDTTASSRENSIQTILAEKNGYVEKLENELRDVRREIDRVTKEDRMVLESLHNQIQELENEVTVQKQIALSTTQENELLKSIIKEKDEEKITVVGEKLDIMEKLAKANEDKFQKMKEVYGKLREEHVQLLRSSSESSKRSAALKKENETLEEKYKNVLQEIEKCESDKYKAVDELEKNRCSVEELSSILYINKSLESDKQSLENKLKVLNEEIIAEQEKFMKQKLELEILHEQLNKTSKEKLEWQDKLLDCEKHRNELLLKLNNALATADENLKKYSVEQQQLISSLETSKQQYFDLEAKHALLTSKFDDLSKSNKSLLTEKQDLQKRFEEKSMDLQAKNQILDEQKAKLNNLCDELSGRNSKIKDLEEQTNILLKEKCFLVEEKQALQKKMGDNIANLERTIEQLKMDIDACAQKESLKNNEILEKLTIACSSMPMHSLSQVENFYFSTLNCTADYLLENIEPTIRSLHELDNILAKEDYRPDPELMINNLINFSYLSSETIQLALATAHAASIEEGEEMSTLTQKIGVQVKELLATIKPGEIKREIYLQHSKLIRISLDQLSSQATRLLPKIEDIQADKLEDLVEKEMQQTSLAIEQATSRIAEILACSRSQQSGLQLEVNEKILDCCNSLMAKIRILIEKSKLLQKEIVSQGRGTSTIKEFYKKHHRWTEGLISAAKAVGFGANLLVDAADKVVDGKGKFEELVVCAQEIAASTAQLVVSSKVKAERGSENLYGLSEASKGVSEATGLVVASAKSGAERIEELDVFHFSKLTLYQAKRKEMDSQVRVLELESLLEKERRKLAELRKTHYQLAGEAEGWDVNLQKQDNEG